jgi:hypothetical protein
MTIENRHMIKYVGVYHYIVYTKIMEVYGV